MRKEYSISGLAHILEVDEAVVNDAVHRLRILPVRVTDRYDDRGAGVPMYGRTEVVRIVGYVLNGSMAAAGV